MRYCLVNNESGDWYLIPADKRKDWDEWLGSIEWEMGETPEYAQYLIWQLHGLTFENPKMGRP